MVGSVAGEVNGRSYNITDVESLIVVEEFVEYSSIFLRRNAVPLTEELLHLIDALTDADGWSMTLDLAETALEI